MFRTLLLSFFLPFSVVAAPVTFLYTANRQGEVDPCGCPDGSQNGGIGRMAAYVDTLKKAPRFFGDAGDTFFSVSTLLPSRRDGELAHAHLIARAYKLMGVDVLTPGERDFAEGIETLRALEAESGTRFVSVNLTDREGKTLFPPSVVVEKGGVKIGVLGAVDPAAFSAEAPVKAGAVQPALDEEVAKLRANGAQVVVLLSHLGLNADRTLAKSVKGIDLILGAHSLDAVSPAQIVDKTRLVQPIYQGQQIGVLTYDGGNWTGDSIVELGKSWDKKPNAVTRLVAQETKKQHDKAVHGAEPAADQTAYVAHPYQCRQCHAKQYDFWESTKHASSYLPLYAKNQHFDPECITCHSLGFQQPGGFASITAPIQIVGAPKRKPGEKPFIEKMMEEVFAEDGKRRPLDSREEPARYAALKKRFHEKLHELERAQKVEHFYLGTQCEHCHGNMTGHPMRSVQPTKVVEKTCRACHTTEQSPNFKWAWRGLVACPKGK